MLNGISVKWNMGLDLGTGSSGISVSTGFQAGGTVWQNTNVFLKRGREIPIEVDVATHLDRHSLYSKYIV